MSSTSSQASAAFPSDLSEQECEPSRSARSSHTAEPCSPSTGQASRSMTTCEPLPLTVLEQTELFPMSSVVASPARTSALQEKALASMESAAAYGLSTPELLARFDQDTSSWRTSQHCLIEGLTVFSETWPRSGTMQSGIAYRLPPLVRLTDEIASGSLPTPSATDFKSESMSAGLVKTRQEASSRGIRLTEWLHRQMLPTPNAGNDHWGARLDEWGGSTKDR